MKRSTFLASLASGAFVRPAGAADVSMLTGMPMVKGEILVSKEIHNLWIGGRDAMQTYIELSLARNRIPTNDKPDGFLTVNVTGLRATASPIYAISVTAEYREWVESLRVPTAQDYVAIWSRSQLLLLGEQRLSAVGETIRTMLDEFCLNYLKANPK